MKKLKLIHWFAIWLVVMCLIVVFTQPETRPEKIDLISFNTTESAELYFKNVRSFYYHSKSEAHGILDVYRLETIFKDSVQTLPFALYNNWRTNEAFIRLDTTFINTRKYSGVAIDSAGILIDTLDFPEGTNESQYRFAVGVYKAIRDKNEVFLSKADSLIPISETQRLSVKRTLTDYFKLIGKL